MNKWSIALIAVVVAGFIGGLVAFSGDTEPDSVVSNTTSESNSETAPVAQVTEGPVGQLVDYSPQALAESEADTNLLFFHAAWCTVCNSVERNLESGAIPEGISIFKLNYDSDEGQDLANKYKIPIQYSMVQVDTEGNELAQWVNNFNDGIAEIQDNIQQF